jgi:hypothetical protein
MVQVTHRPILAAVDGKIQNEIYENNWSKRCPFCWATPDDVIDGEDSDIEEQDDVEEDPDEFPGPLHYLINTGKCVFKAGTRNMPGTRKYNVEFSKGKNGQKAKVETRWVS